MPFTFKFGSRTIQVPKWSEMTWNSISGKPTAFTPAGHTHDDRYYTEAEMNTKLNAKLNISGGTITGDLGVNGYIRAGTSGNSRFTEKAVESSQRALEIKSPGRVEFLTCTSLSYAGTLVQILREQSATGRTLIRPATNGGAYIGTTSFRWNTAFFTNAITASDLKEKDVIDDFDFRCKEFIMNLKPIAYHRKGDGDNGKRIHIGLGAQDVNKLIKELGIGDLSLVQASIVGDDEERPYHGEDIDDEKLSWGLNYTELIPYLIKMVQSLQNEIDELKRSINNA